jgi:hypothetical protein
MGNENIFEGFSELIEWFHEEEGVDRNNLDLGTNYLKFKEFVNDHKDDSRLDAETFEILSELEEKRGHFVRNLFDLFTVISLVERSGDPLIEWRIESFEEYLKDVLKTNFGKIEADWHGFKRDSIKFSDFVNRGIEILGKEFVLYLFPLVGKKE